MSRTLSKIFVKLNIGIYAVNFAVLFIVAMMGLSVTGNAGLYLIPGIALVGLVCLIYPDFYNVVGGMFGWQSISNPTSADAFQHATDIFNSAFGKDYSFLKNNGIPTATFCVVLCWIVGIACLFQQAGLLKIVESPMDWFKKKFLSTYIYCGFGTIYGVTMLVGAFAVIFAPDKLSGGLLTLAWFFAICGLAIVAGVVLLIVERFIAVQAYNALSVDEQIALCEKQAKYMNKRQRKRQVKRLGDKARTGNVKGATNTQTPTETPTEDTNGGGVQLDATPIEPSEPATTSIVGLSADDMVEVQPDDLPRAETPKDDE